MFWKQGDFLFSNKTGNIFKRSSILLFLFRLLYGLIFLGITKVWLKSLKCSISISETKVGLLKSLMWISSNQAIILVNSFNVFFSKSFKLFLRTVVKKAYFILLSCIYQFLCTLVVSDFSIFGDLLINLLPFKFLGVCFLLSLPKPIAINRFLYLWK